MEETSIIYSVTTLTLLFHSLIFTSCMAKTPTIETDESALLALKAAISYDPQNVISTNWSSSTPVCSWFGVICSLRHRRVSALNISDMNLRGEIPPQLGNISFLMSLDMSNNSFYGALPQELAGLSRLRSINLRGNNFMGPIPSFLSSLPTLKFLSLRGNKFSGPIPTTISNISNLEKLNLRGNFLEGKIPQEIFSNLNYLTYLNLENNSLTGPIPSSLFNLSSLQVLALTSNYLTGQLPVSMCDRLPHLKELYLSFNGLDGRIPSNLQKCEQLQTLVLSYNEFIGSIPREIGNLTCLKILYLGINNLEGPIPTEISNLQKLSKFGLDDNSFNGSIPEGIFNISTLQVFTSAGTNLSGSLPPSFGLGMPNLQELYLNKNQLGGFIPESISNASKLTVLELSNNHFTGPIPDSLGSLEFLQVLQLIGNKFTSLSSTSELSILTSLTNCRHLRRLMIDENPLGGKLPTSIGNFSTSLQVFGAYRCRIMGKVPQEIGNLTSLAKLSLSHNELNGDIPTTVKSLQKLGELYLSYNKITGFIPNEICSLKKLGALGLRENQLFGVLPECLGNMTSLRTLQLASNGLNSNLPVGIWKLKDMLQFNVSSNMLTGNLPLEIGNLKALNLIDLSMNNLSGNIPTTIGDLQNLIHLSLAQNKLEGPIPDSFGRILSLENLDISQNNLIGEIPRSLEALLYLTCFNASFNDLSGEIPNDGPFANFTENSFMHNKALCGAARFQVPKCGSVWRKRNRALHIALYAILGFASVTVLLVGWVLLRCQKRRNDATDRTPVLRSQLLSHERISYEELRDATDGFSESNIIGKGAFSCVYKGRLRDGFQVVAKVFNVQLEGAFRSFTIECEALRNLRHRNLTKVISSCTNADFKALVLEYMPNESLEKWLYSHNNFLGILQRLNIVIDVANALDYLHNGYLVPVVHCDLKPSNVLLDNELVGHISDFGISKILGAGDNIARTKTLATIGYIAPEYGLEGLVSTRSDIYSYGILLMETFTRMKPSDNMFSEELSLKQWIKDSLLADISRVIDPNLLIQEEGDIDAKVQCILSIMELSLKCTEEIPELRISVKDVGMMLNKIKLEFLASCGTSGLESSDEM